MEAKKKLWETLPIEHTKINSREQQISKGQELNYFNNISIVPFICTEYPVILTSSFSTVTHGTAWCWSKFVHVKPTAVAHTDALRQSTTRPTEVEAHCGINNPVSYGGVHTIQPAWRMGATSVLSHTECRHLSTRCTTKSVPAIRKVIVTTDRAIIVIH